MMRLAGDLVERDRNKGMCIMDDKELEKQIRNSHYDRVCAVIDMKAIEQNMEVMRKKLPQNQKFMAVIKTNGYGHGAVPIAKMLEDKEYMFGFATATYEEAVMLREEGVKKPIMILGYTFPYAYEEIIREGIRPAVFRYDQLEQFSQAADKADAPVYAHIAVDTGMGRIGVTPDEQGVLFVEKAFHTPGMEVEGIFTHFAKSDEADKTFSRVQYQKFMNFVTRCEERIGRRIPICHCSNSAGITELPEYHCDMVRMGITMYGLWPSDEIDRELVSLRPAFSLRSHIVYLKEIEAGTPISYGGTFVSDRKMKIATIPVGYGDGYPRSLSNVGSVLIHGKYAPITGRVCMDQFMVDVTGIEDVKEGDPVVLVGKQGEAEITMEELGRLSGRFNYELACLMNERIPRMYIENTV